MTVSPQTTRRALDWLLRARASAGLAVALLIAFNLLPLAGVLLLGWDVFTLLLLYWAENGIVGLLNVVKIALASGPPGVGAGSRRLVAGGLQKVSMLTFFVVHYGIFWTVHGVFVLLLPSLASGPLGAPVEIPLAGVALGALGLAISHTASLWLNYIGRGEYRRTAPAAQFVQPYPRMVVLHVTILLGGFVIIGLGQPLLLIVLLVALKTSLDLVLHLREHALAGRAAQQPG